jgi:voltage-gated potassium channel
MFFLSLIIGVFMIALTVAIHAVGAAHWLHYIADWHTRQPQVSGARMMFRAVVRTSIVLLLLHFLEMILWALLYIALPAKAGLGNFYEAIYFSMITFTTLGYGDITLSAEWNLLSGMEAMVGITVFGLTTALLFAVIQQIWKVNLHVSKSG